MKKDDSLDAAAALGVVRKEGGGGSWRGEWGEEGENGAFTLLG